MDHNNIIEKLNEIALEANWGSVFRIGGVPKHVAIINEAIEEITTLRKQLNESLYKINDLEREIRKRKGGMKS